MTELETAIDICKCLQSENHIAVFAGGYVRDTLANKPCNDIDIATDCLTNISIPILAHYGYIVKSVGKSVGKSFEVLLVSKNNFTFELACFRKEIGCDGRHFDHMELASIEEDAQRRDFTINALFYNPITNQYYDYVNGVRDIENKVLRFVGNPEERIKEDYLRLLRFIRFQVHGYISNYSPDFINSFSSEFNNHVAKDRISKELTEKILMSKVGDFMKVLTGYKDLCNVIYPALYKHEVTDAYTLNLLIDRLLRADKYKVNYKVYLSLMFINMDTDIVKEELSTLRFSNDDIEYICNIISNYKKLYSHIDLATTRTLKASNFFDDMLIVCDVMISDNEKFIYDISLYNFNKQIASNYTNLPAPFITGDTLIELGYKPCPEFKNILNTLYMNQLNNLYTSKEKAINILKSSTFDSLEHRMEKEFM